MAKVATLNEWEECGFESREDMQTKLAKVEATSRHDRARLAETVKGDKGGLAGRLGSFSPEQDRGAFLMEAPCALGISGGRTSGYMLYRILEAHGGKLPEGVLAIFQNTGKERDETLEFLHEIETRWDVPLVWLEYMSPPILGMAPRHARYRVVDHETAFRDSWPDTHNGRRRPFNALFDTFTHYRRKAKNLPPVIPNARQRICTAGMKMKTQYKYLRDLGWDYWDGAAGIRADEPRRVANARLALKTDRADPVFPLATASVTEEEVMEFWSQQPFDLQLQQGEGNCDLCFLKSVPVQLSLLHKYPERADWWIAREEETGDVFRRDLSRNTKGPRGFKKMLARAQSLTEEKIEELRASGAYPDSLPCSCTD